MKKKIRMLTGIAILVAIGVSGCAGRKYVENRQTTVTESKRKDTHDNQQTDDVTKVEEKESQQIEEIPQVVWNEFERVDYAVLAAMLHSTTNHTEGCELLDLDKDGAVELVYIRENEKWAPRFEVFVADVDNQPALTYISDISACGDATISVIRNQLWFCVAYAKVEEVLFENYMWDGEWKLISKEEFDGGTDVREVSDFYDEVETIVVPNGDYEEIVRLYQEHLNDLYVPYNRLEGSSDNSVVFEVEDYASSWKRYYRDYEGESAGLNPDIKDGISMVEISKDADGNVEFSICIDNQRTVLN